MSLADELTQATDALRGRCPVLGIPASLDVDDQATFAGVVDDPTVVPDALAIALAAVGVRVAADVIRAHRERSCPCGMKGV